MSGLKRKLGQIEASMAAMHGAALGTTMGAKVISLSGGISPDALWRGAAAVFERYPALRCAICDEDGAPTFVEHADFQRIALRQHIVAEQREWCSIELDEVHAPLDQSQALWRMSLLSSKDGATHKLILVFHHAIIDAAGANQVAQELLEFADRDMQGLPLSVDRLGLAPAVDDFLGAAGAARPDDRRCAPIDYARFAPIEERRTDFVFSRLRADDAARLNARCAASGLSANAVFGAALSLAACGNGLAASPVSFKTAVSLREYAVSRGAAGNELGCYLAVADTPLEIEGMGLEEIARLYQKQLMSATMKHCFRRREFSFAAISTMVAGAMQSRQFGGFGITNLGKVDLDQRFAHFEVLGNYSLTNRVAGNYAFALQVAEFRGEFEFIYAFVRPLLERAALERLSATFDGLLADYQ